MATLPNDPEQVRMSFAAHLDELRSRIFRGLLVIGVLFVVSFGFSSYVRDIFMHPWETMRESLAEREPPIEIPDLGVIGVTEGIFFSVKTSLVISLLIGFPYLLYQIWAFIAAGLYPGERKTVSRFIPWGMALGVAGVCFGYFFMIPMVLEFLALLNEKAGFVPLYTVGEYFSFFLLLTIALALVFQLPLILMGLGAAGIVDAAFLRKYRRHFILGAFVIGAFLTPPEPVSQLLMAAPTIVLYEVGILLVAWRGRPKEAAEEAA